MRHIGQYVGSTSITKQQEAAWDNAMQPFRRRGAQSRSVRLRGPTSPSPRHPASRASANSVRLMQRRPYRYALALVLACASLVALILLYADRSIPIKDKATQVGAGLAASIIFAVIYTIFANREYAELISILPRRNSTRVSIGT